MSSVLSERHWIDSNASRFPSLSTSLKTLCQRTLQRCDPDLVEDHLPGVGDFANGAQDGTHNFFPDENDIRAFEESDRKATPFHNDCNHDNRGYVYANSDL